MSASDPSTRPMTTNESEVLRAWLAHDFRDAEKLRDQLAAGVEVFSSCGCGCPSIGFVDPADGSDETSFDVVEIEATVFNDRGEAIGGMLLMTKGGKLHDIDAYSTVENYSFPSLDRVAFD